MKIALFLDVDRTLTKNYIQEDYAVLLECNEEYQAIETDFQRNQDSDKFGERLISLFKEHNFDRGFAIKNFEKISLLPWSDRLLKLQVSIFLVSNGPSYYIEQLAERYNIPLENVICSTYHFNKETQLIDSCDAVSNAGKADFVADKAKNFDFSIGVGDSPRHDAPFLTNCSMGFIIQREGIPIPNDRESSSFFYTVSLERILRVVELIKNQKNSVNKFGLQDITVKDLIANTKVTAIRGLWVLFVSLFSIGLLVGKYLSN